MCGDVGNKETLALALLTDTIISTVALMECQTNNYCY